MRIMLLGGGGFIGTNLAIKLSKNGNDAITLVDRDETSFENIKKLELERVFYRISNFDVDTDFEELLKSQDVVYHLVSTTVPSTSNQKIPEELTMNVVTTSRMLDACVKLGIKKVVFLSSGGTVYGKKVNCPLRESTATNPISSYGIQKVTIEKLLYLYNYMYDLDYRVIRLANPYGPYQRPNGVLGAVTTFTYKALKGDKIVVYGDGSVVRDFIYIDDAVRGILKIVNGDNEYKIFNLGSGYGVSIKEVLNIIQETLQCEISIDYSKGRKVDVPVNYLDITRYENAYGKLNPIRLEEGIRKTADFMKKNYKI